MIHFLQKLATNFACLQFGAGQNIVYQSLFVLKAGLITMQ